MWIKICANTTLDDTLLAVEAGADAVGFVFASSPRRVTAEQVASITPHLPATIEKIGVFVDASFDEIARTVAACSLSGVQLHGNAENAMSAQLRKHFGASLRILQVVHFTANAADEIQRIFLDRSIDDPSNDAILIDSRTATAVGGTGTSFDWKAAQETLFTADRKLKLIAAGGLTPLNVAEAIRLLAPWGVDVASGVELTAGKKDPAKIREFVQNARAAAQSFPSQFRG